MVNTDWAGEMKRADTHLDTEGALWQGVDRNKSGRCALEMGETSEESV